MNGNPKCSICRTYFIPTLKTSGLPYKCCDRCREIQKEYQKENREEIKEYQKEYKQENRVKIKEYYIKNRGQILIKTVCLCGAEICKAQQIRHFKSKTHQFFILKQAALMEKETA